MYWFVKVHLAKHKEQAGGPDARAPKALVLTLVSIGPRPAMVQSPDVPKQYRTMAAVACIVGSPSAQAGGVSFSSSSFICSFK